MRSWWSCCGHLELVPQQDSLFHLLWRELRGEALLFSRAAGKDPPSVVRITPRRSGHTLRSTCFPSPHFTSNCFIILFTSLFSFTLCLKENSIISNLLVSRGQELKIQTCVPHRWCVSVKCVVWLLPVVFECVFYWISGLASFVPLYTWGSSSKCCV